MSLEVNGRTGLLQRLSIIKKVVWGNARNKGSRAAIVVKTRVNIEMSVALPLAKPYLFQKHTTRKILTFLAPHLLVKYIQHLKETSLTLPMSGRARLSSPPGEQDSSSSLNIQPLNSPRLPVELLDEIAKIRSEDLVEQLCQIVTPHLYKFNGRMLEKSQRLPWGEVKPTLKWDERSAMQWAAQNGSQGTARAVMEMTPKHCKVRHFGIAIRHRHYEFAKMLLE
ncbi:unnamed protein product [Clonostachys chloroleuca]|uniref:Uncharacterized protein n=1 Tax=Clonostachys chloroleuca TaxID=1926264 RepID=A0AA35Q5Y9_9HYPO|nr:unnamed protein product [Clonostachys chloroleuca]